MKLHVLLTVVALHGTFYQHYQCKAINSSEVLRTSLRLSESHWPVPPVPVRLGEEYFFRLESPKKQGLQTYLAQVGTINHALWLKLTQRLPRGQVEDNDLAEYKDPAERWRRADDLPLSLDLTFLLLREVLEMARAQQLAQQASSNRKMMDFFGKK